MEVIDIGFDDLDTDMKTNHSSVTGIEFLMNDRKRTSSGSTKIDLQELDNLENELNALSDVASNSEAKKLSGLSGFSNFFNCKQKSSFEL